MPTNITPIEHTYDLPGGAFRMVQIADETDAARCANGQPAYLYRSRIIDALYLFVEVQL